MSSSAAGQTAARGADTVVVPARPGDDAKRDAFVREQPGATFFHLVGWGRAIERIYGHECRDLLAWRGDEIVGVLPLMLCRGLAGRKNLISVPYGTYGGPVGIDHDVERLLLTRAKGLAEELAVGRLEVRFLDDVEQDLPGTDLYATFIRPLPERPEDVLASMPKKARAEARKARDNHGLVLTHGRWYADDLCRMFLLNKHQLGSPGLPARHFEELVKEFKENLHVHLVRRERVPVAAVMSFAFGHTLIAYYAGTLPGADRAWSASNFMYTALQEWAVERGFRTFDFCRSRTDSGAFQFKRHQGFEPKPLHYRFYLVRNKELPSFTPSNPRTRLLRATWSRLPLWFVRFASTRIATYLP